MTEQRRALMFTRHWALTLVIVIPLIPTAHREASLVKRRHVTQNPVVQPGADNGHQDAPQQPAPRRITPVPSCTLANALCPDIRGVLEPCLWPAQHTIHTYISACRVVTSEFDDSLVSLHLTHVPISQFSTLGDDISSRHYLNLSLFDLQQDTLIHFTAMHRFRGCQLVILSHMHFIVPNSILL
jgi:hypothetical protein